MDVVCGISIRDSIQLRQCQGIHRKVSGLNPAILLELRQLKISADRADIDIRHTTLRQSYLGHVLSLVKSGGSLEKPVHGSLLVELDLGISFFNRQRALTSPYGV